MNENPENNIPEETPESLEIAYKLGFMDFLLETDSEIRQKFFSYLLAYRAEQIEMFTTLFQAQELINKKN